MDTRQNARCILCITRGKFVSAPTGQPTIHMNVSYHPSQTVRLVTVVDSVKVNQACQQVHSLNNLSRLDTA